MSYERGVFRTYIANAPVHIGSLSIQLKVGDEVEFDGHILRFGGREEPLGARIKSAIKMGWLRLPDGEVVEYKPKRAATSVTPADNAGSKEKQEVRLDVYHEENAVGDLGLVEDRRQAASRPKPAPSATERAAAQQRAASNISNVSDKGVHVEVDDFELDEVLAELEDENPKSLKGVSAAEKRELARAQAANKKTLAAIRAKLEHDDALIAEHLAAREEEEKQKEAASKAGGKYQVVPESSPIESYKFQVKAAAIGEGVAGEGEVEKRNTRVIVRPPERVDGNTPKKAAPPAPARQPEADSLQEIITGWDKTQHWQKRVKEALDFYGDSPNILNAICEIESPGVVKKIKAAMSA